MASIFYYPWYSTEGHDGAYRHWQQSGRRPPADIASSFYPLRGVYSSGSRAVLQAHMREIKAAGIGTVVTSWWGRGSLEDRRLGAVLAAARKMRLLVAAHLEPYPGRSIESIEDDLQYLVIRGIREVYVYQPTDFTTGAWASLNRRTTGVVLLAQTGKVGFAAAARFRGVYTYDVLVYGGGSFARICAQARAAGLVCAPSVGPGYRAERAGSDRRLKTRKNGATYDSMWQAALRARASRVTITSYNEWHEGTQIEPARSGRSGYFSYLGAFGGPRALAPCSYLLRTAQWVRAFAGGQSLVGRPLATRGRAGC